MMIREVLTGERSQVTIDPRGQIPNQQCERICSVTTKANIQDLLLVILLLIHICFNQRMKIPKRKYET